MKTAVALTTDDGVSAPHALLVQALVAPLRVTLQAIADFDAAMAQRAQAHPDFPLFDAFPGAGAGFAPRLLVTFGEQRERSASAAARQKYAGIAPVTDRRGKPSWGHWRLQCPTFLRPPFVEWAAAAIRHAFWAPVYYPQQRDTGKAHPGAVRALAFQMAPPSLSLLATSHPVRGGHLSPGAPSPWLIADAKSGTGLLKNRKNTLTAPLRACVRQSPCVM